MKKTKGTPRSKVYHLINIIIFLLPVLQPAVLFKANRLSRHQLVVIVWKAWRTCFIIFLTSNFSYFYFKRIRSELNIVANEITVLLVHLNHYSVNNINFNQLPFKSKLLVLHCFFGKNFMGWADFLLVKSKFLFSTSASSPLSL